MKVDIGHWVCEAWVWSSRMVPKAGWEQNMFWVVVSNIFYFHPYLGKIPNLTNIFQMGWNHQPVLHGVKRFVKFCETISAVFTVNLEFRRYYRYSSYVCINNRLYTGPFLLDHLGTSMATSTGTSWRVASLAWAGVIQDAILGCKINVAVCLKKFRRDSVRTMVKNRMNVTYNSQLQDLAKCPKSKFVW